MIIFSRNFVKNKHIIKNITMKLIMLCRFKGNVYHNYSEIVKQILLKKMHNLLNNKYL